MCEHKCKIKIGLCGGRNVYWCSYCGGYNIEGLEWLLPKLQSKSQKYDKDNDWHGKYIHDQISAMRNGSKTQNVLVEVLNNYLEGERNV